jgi:hypothetical protein
MATPLNTKVYVVYSDFSGLVDTMLEFLPGEPALMGTNSLARILGRPESHDEWHNRSIIIPQPCLNALAAIFFLIRNNPTFGAVEFYRVMQGPKREQIELFSSEWDKHLE